MPAEQAEDHIGTRIRLAREQRGWTQTELAEKMAVVPRTVRNWEQTGAVPRRKLAMVDDALRTLPDASIYDEDYIQRVNLARFSPPSPAVTAIADEAARLVETVAGPTIRAAAEVERQMSILSRLQVMRAGLQLMCAELDQVITELGGEPS